MDVFIALTHKNGVLNYPFVETSIHGAARLIS